MNESNRVASSNLNEPLPKIMPGQMPNAKLPNYKFRAVTTYLIRVVSVFEDFFLYINNI
jgi:hypothetical protein